MAEDKDIQAIKETQARIETSQVNLEHMMNSNFISLMGNVLNRMERVESLLLAIDKRLQK